MERLEAVPAWTWDTREAAWNEGFDALNSFVDREGHARVPCQTQGGRLRARSMG